MSFKTNRRILGNIILEIPTKLVKSLMELGLLESEAKIYIALAMMENSEVKKLIDFLSYQNPIFMKVSDY